MNRIRRILWAIIITPFGPESHSYERYKGEKQWTKNCSRK